MYKILFLQSGYAHYRSRLFELLAERHKIKFIYERSFNVYPGEINVNNLDCMFLKAGNLMKWFELLNILHTENPDIVITSISSSFRTFLSYIFCKTFKKKFVLWIIEWKRPTYKPNSAMYIVGNIRYRLAKKIIVDCDALIVGGRKSQEYALSLGKKKKDIFYALQCAEDMATTKIYKWNEHSKHIDDKFIFLYLGRIIEWKGLSILLKAFSKLENENNDVALIVGGDGDYRGHCIELSKKLSIKNIEFRGAIIPDDRPKTYKEANAFILPSFFCGNSYEAWGLVINEAMSMSLPIITTTAVGAAYDLIEKGVNGYVVNENNVGELYGAMSRLLNTDAKRMGHASRQIYETKNDYSKMAYGFSQAINYAMAGYQSDDEL